MMTLAQLRSIPPNLYKRSNRAPCPAGRRFVYGANTPERQALFQTGDADAVPSLCSNMQAGSQSMLVLIMTPHNRRAS